MSDPKGKGHDISGPRSAAGPGGAIDRTCQPAGPEGLSLDQVNNSNIVTARAPQDFRSFRLPNIWQDLAATPDPQVTAVIYVLCPEKMKSATEVARNA